MTKGIVKHIRESKDKPAEYNSSEYSLADLEKWFKVVTEMTRPSKDKPIHIVSGQGTIRNAGNGTEILMSDNSWRKIDGELFVHTREVKFID